MSTVLEQFLKGISDAKSANIREKEFLDKFVKENYMKLTNDRRLPVHDIFLITEADITHTERFAYPAHPIVQFSDKTKYHVFCNQHNDDWTKIRIIFSPLQPTGTALCIVTNSVFHNGLEDKLSLVRVIESRKNNTEYVPPYSKVYDCYCEYLDEYNNALDFDHASKGRGDFRKRNYTFVRSICFPLWLRINKKDDHKE